MGDRWADEMGWGRGDLDPDMDCLKGRYLVSFREVESKRLGSVDKEGSASLAASLEAHDF